MMEQKNQINWIDMASGFGQYDDDRHFLGMKPPQISSEGLVDYLSALAWQESYIDQMQKGQAAEAAWLLEHPHLYTAGTSSKDEDLFNGLDLPVYKAGRGGQYTYHGPGQRVAYVFLDLGQRGRDVRAYIWQLEEWIIRTLADFNIKGERRDKRVGIWVVNQDGSEDKIAAIGVRIRKWISFHGVAINIDPDLRYYQGIIPCGIKNHGVTSLKKLGVSVTLPQFDAQLKQHFYSIFSH